MTADQLYRVLQALDRGIPVLIACEAGPDQVHPLVAVNIAQTAEGQAVLVLAPAPHQLPATAMPAESGAPRA